MPPPLSTIQFQMKFLLSLVLVIGSLTLCLAQENSSHFKYDPNKLPLHQLQVYIKSNLDGSHASFVAVYMKDSDTIESFKWTEGNSLGTLVRAIMDWQRFSVSHFEGGRLSASGELDIRAQLAVAKETNEAKVQIAGAEPNSVTLKHFPWHSYDFDFASLGVVMSQKVARTPLIEFMIYDIAGGTNGPAFTEMGKVSMKEDGVEEKFGYSCQRYRIDGPGLDERGGSIWFDDQGRLVGFEIQKPDEPGFVSNKLRRIELLKLSVAEWETFKKQKLQH